MGDISLFFVFMGDNGHFQIKYSEKDLEYFRFW